MPRSPALSPPARRESHIQVSDSALRSSFQQIPPEAADVHRTTQLAREIDVGEQPLQGLCARIRVGVAQFNLVLIGNRRRADEGDFEIRFLDRAAQVVLIESGGVANSEFHAVKAQIR